MTQTATDAGLLTLRHATALAEESAETVLRYGNGGQLTELCELLEDLQWRVGALAERAGGKFQQKVDGAVADELIRDSAEGGAR